MITAVETRKTISFTYDMEAVQGNKAFISARNPANDEPLEDKKEIINDGSGAVSFPMTYEGECYVEVHGSRGGEDSGIIVVA